MLNNCALRPYHNLRICSGKIAVDDIFAFALLQLNILPLSCHNSTCHQSHRAVIVPLFRSRAGSSERLHQLLCSFVEDISSPGNDIPCVTSTTFTHNLTSNTMALPKLTEKAMSSVHDIISKVMDELMDEAPTAEKASPSTPQNSSPVEVASAIATKCDHEVRKSRPTSCGNERYMKNAGYFKTCSKRGVILCPTCKLVQVSAALKVRT